MSLMQSPDEIILLHRAKVREERDRNRHPHVTDLSPRQRQSTIRTAVGNMLIAAGSRLATQHDPAEPVVGRLSVAR